MSKGHSLERKMLSYFGLIAAASLLITIEFIVVTHGIAPLRNKALLMFVVQVAVTLIVLIMFMRRITGPLQHMVDASKTISDGDLTPTIRVESKDEIGLLAETINGLTSNIQEIVAFGLSTESAVREAACHLRGIATDEPKATEYLDDIESSLEGFRDFMGSFHLLPPPQHATDGADER